MAAQRLTSPKQRLFFGAIASVAGGYFTLVGAGLLPIPGGPGKLHAPLWVVLCAGLIFLLAGGALVIQAVGRADAHGELPADTPVWLRAVQYVMGLAIFACFALIGSWIAFGPGERNFSGSFGFFGAQTNAIIGRTIFGISAVMVLLCALGFAIVRARKLFRRT